MSSPEPLQALQARWVIPVDAPPIAGGVVMIRGSQIVAVGREAVGCTPLDLGDVAIAPGLVNAHTHLEFSDLVAPLGAAGMPLPDWIRQVVARRRAAAPGTPDCVLQGLQESLAAGVTAVGEIATTDWRAEVVNRADAWPWVRMFYELLGARRDRVESVAADGQAFLAAPAAPSIAPGLSPHASYTVHPRLLAHAVTLACQYGLPLAMHLAEAPQELELLATGGGPFADLLRDFGAWETGSAPRLPRIADYLRQLARAPRSLVIHGNYLSDDEIELLAGHAQRMSLVYCPRTHHFFGHAPYPLTRMLRAGVAMALGTDSRASNPDLDLLAEMRFVREHHPRIAAEKVLALGTIDGARALGLASQCGSLTPGKRANLAILQLPVPCPPDAYEAVLRPPARVVQTWLDGRPVARPRSV
jgi:cytosine/adenosine deaminase-related metal-dependent hydrolase